MNDHEFQVSTKVLGQGAVYQVHVAPTEPLLHVLQRGAEVANEPLLPSSSHPLDKLHNLRGGDVGPAITDLDQPLGQFLRNPEATKDFGIELVLAIRVNAQWRVATATSMAPRQILELFELNPSEYSLYLGQRADPLPVDTAILLKRGEGFEAQRDGKYGENK